MKCRSRLLLALGLLALVAGVVIIVRSYQARHALDVYKRELVTAGEKLAAAELLPSFPLTGQDGTKLFIEAAALMGGRGTTGPLSTNFPTGMLPTTPGHALIQSQQPQVVQDGMTNSWKELQSDVQTHLEGFELLYALINKPKIVWGIDYQNGTYRTSFPSLLPFVRGMRKLNAATVIALNCGDIPAAITNSLAMLALLKGLSEEPSDTVQAMRMSMASLTIRSQWELLQASNLTDAQLSLLQKAWEEVEYIQALERSLAMARVQAMALAESMKESSKVYEMSTSWGYISVTPALTISNGWREKITASMGKHLDGMRLEARRAQWRLAWADQDQRTAMQGFQTVILALRQGQSAGKFGPAFCAMDQKLAALGIRSKVAENEGFRNSDPRKTVSQESNFAQDAAHRLLAHESARRLVIVCIALKRYQLRHGHWPAALSKLSPEFLAAVPSDPIDGESLRYGRMAEVVQLYSIGEDGVDDGGNPEPKNEGSRNRHWLNGRDWVWPQPATGEEIAAYYMRLSQGK